MRRVGVEKSAAIGTQLLDGDLRCRRPQGQGLLFGFRRFSHRFAFGIHDGFAVRIQFRRLIADGFLQGNRLVRAKILHHALPDQHQGQNQRQRQQYIERAARHIHPEIAYAVGIAAGKYADQRHQHRHAAGCRHEVLHRQTQHLRQITHGGFAAIALPVGVTDETNRSVER